MNSPAAVSRNDLRVETADVVGRLRSALTAIVSEVAGRPLVKSRDAQKHFGVDVKLSWQLFRTLSGSDPLEAVSHIPPQASMAKLIREVRRKRIPDALVTRAEQSYAAFEEHVNRHAGDRQSFSRMLDSGATTIEDERPHRETVFEANRHVWGVQLDATLQVTMLHPVPQPASGGGRERFQMASLLSLGGFCRWSVTAPTMLFAHAFGAEPGQAELEKAQPLDPVAFARYGVPLIDRFTTSPGPLFRSRRVDESLIVTELADEAVGRLNCIDVTQGQFFPGVPLMEQPDGRLGWTFARINARPTRVATADLIVHRPTFGLLRWETSRWGNVSSFPKRFEDLDRSVGAARLPNVDPLTFLGSVPGVAPAHGVDDYPAMIRFVCDRQGWDVNEMDVYRQCSVFPLLSTMDVVQFTVPDGDA